MEGLVVRPRATHDIDMIVIAENLGKSLVAALDCDTFFMEKMNHLYQERL